MGKEAWGVEISGGYFDESRHLYRGPTGVIVPSTTQVFDVLGLNDFSGISPDVLEWKRSYGIALHKAIELAAVGDLDWDSVDEQIKPGVAGVNDFLKSIEYVSETAEKRMVFNLCGMNYGLTTDNVGTMMFHGMRRHVVLDLKTGSKKSPTWDWQLGGYVLAQPKVAGGYVGLIAQIKMDGGVVPHYVDTTKAGREFQILLAACNLKLNAGLAKIGG